MAQKKTLYLVKIWASQDGEVPDEPEIEQLIEMTPAQKRSLNKLLCEAVATEYDILDRWEIKKAEFGDLVKLRDIIEHDYFDHAEVEDDNND